jgi:hypothetical protein
LFVATLSGTGVTTGNDSSVWVVRNSQLSLFAREGTVIDVGNGSGIFKTLGDQGLSLFTITDAGVVWRTSFTDLSTAVIFASVVPESSLVICLALILIACLMIHYRVRTRNGTNDLDSATSPVQSDRYASGEPETP